MSLRSWLSLPFKKPLRVQTPAIHLLHRWKGGRAHCAECGSADYDDVLHLHPSSRLITIQDVMTEMSKPKAARPYVPGALLDLAAAVFYVDEGATVYLVAGYPGMVFVELGDPALRGRVGHFAAQYRPIGVLLVFVGCGG